MSRLPKYPAYPKIRLSLSPPRRRRPGLLRRLGGGLWRRLAQGAEAEPGRPAGRQPGARADQPEPEIQLKIAVPKPRPTRVGPLAEAALKRKFQAGPPAPPEAEVKPPAPPEAKPAVRPEAKPAVRPEVKPAARPEPDIKPTARPEPDIKPAVRPEPEAQPAARPEPEPAAWPEPQPAAWPELKPARAAARRPALWLALAAALLAGLSGYYAYRRYVQPPPRAKVARIPAASLPKVAPLAAGLFERRVLALEEARTTEVTVAPGSNLGRALEEVGLNSRNNFRGVLDCLAGGEEPLGLVRPGDVLRAFWADPEHESLARLEFHPATKAAPWVVLPDGQGGFWRFSQASRILNIGGAGSGRVEGSLWNAGLRAGLDGSLIMTMADVLASDIDFFTGLKKGDAFELLYSRDYQDGRPQGAPIIEMVRMVNNGRTFEYYRHINANGQAGYYNREGRSNLKTFFASPLQYTRISSGFSMARNHPIYKVVRPHQGVDYAAPTGTPVSAVADGKVTTARWSGGFGRLVAVQHDAVYTTMYGHLSSFAPGLKEGSTVRQGDLVGRVGASGTATGPHLDFRLRKNGVFVDPIPELAKQVGRRLEGAEAKAFAGVVPVLQKRLAEQLALAALRPAAREALPLEPELDFVEPDPASLDL